MKLDLSVLLQVVINLLSNMVSVTTKMATDIIISKSSPLTIKTRKGRSVKVTFYECDMSKMKKGQEKWSLDPINKFHTLQEIPQELLAEYEIYVAAGFMISSPAFCIDVSSMRRETDHIEYAVIFDKSLRNSEQFIPVMFHELGHIYFQHYEKGVRADNENICNLTAYDEHMCDKFAERATGKKIDLMTLVKPYYNLMIKYGLMTKVQAAKVAALIYKDVQEVRH